MLTPLVKTLMHILPRFVKMDFPNKMGVKANIILLIHLASTTIRHNRVSQASKTSPFEEVMGVTGEIILVKHRTGDFQAVALLAME